MGKSSELFIELRQEIQVVDDGMVFYLSSLLENSIYDEDVKEAYYREMSEGMDINQYNSLKDKFYESQKDKISSGLNYGQNDIVRHLRKLK